MRLVYLSIAGVLFFSQQALALCDSIGVKTVNGKSFIMHKVTKGEGLYSIGREYGVPANDIKKSNAGLENHVNIGQVILVPYKKPAKNASDDKKKAAVTGAKKQKISLQPATNSTKAKSPVYHTVASSETLYSIAVKNGVQVADISKWNKLKGNEISVGQKLVVGYKSVEKVSADGAKNKWEKPVNDKNDAAKTDKPAENKPEENKVRGNDWAEKKAENASAERKDEKADGVKTVWKEINESGVASWIDDGSMDKDKKYALHKSAPVGTVIKLVNPMNRQTAVVKVIGRLPQDGTEENVVIKITKSSAEKLGLRDKYFQLNMSYGLEVEKKK
ncbi:MAG: LysM peptidoglycan-binding domain-containing protein [Bacteroidia bacterium]